MGHRHGPDRALSTIRSRGAEHQVLVALRTNRRTRHREGRFLVQGVRPITAAVERGWPLDALLHRPGPLSGWATTLLARGGSVAPTVRRVEVVPELLAELGGRDEGAPELVAVAMIPTRPPVPAGADLVLVADRTASPGNLGTMIRTADALGAAALVLVGHAADPFDPKAVRASRGSIFAVPVVAVASAAEALEVLGGLQVVVASEDATTPLWAVDLTPPTAVVVGSEAEGVGRRWREASDRAISIPQTGTASSLNAAVSAAVVLYEVRRQRAGRAGTPPL